MKTRVGEGRQTEALESCGAAALWKMDPGSMGRPHDEARCLYCCLATAESCAAATGGTPDFLKSGTTKRGLLPKSHKLDCFGIKNRSFKTT